MNKSFNTYSRFIALLAFAVSFFTIPAVATITSGGNDNVYADYATVDVTWVNANTDAIASCDALVNFIRNVGGNCDAASNVTGYFSIAHGVNYANFSSDGETFWTNYMENFDLNLEGDTANCGNIPQYSWGDGFGQVSTHGHLVSEINGYSWGLAQTSLTVGW